MCRTVFSFASHSGFESNGASVSAGAAGSSAAETGAGAGSSGALAAASEEVGSSGCAVEESFSG